MNRPAHILIAGASLLAAVPLPAQTPAASLPREQWGAPAVKVSQAEGRWILAGKKQTVILNASGLALEVRAGSALWKMVPSRANDLRVRSAGQELSLRLADARKIEITPYDTGFKTGVRIELADWPARGNLAALKLHLAVCLEGAEEELVFDAAAEEPNATVRQLDWPAALDARDVDCTLLSNGKGNLLPRDWPKEYSANSVSISAT